MTAPTSSNGSEKKEEDEVRGRFEHGHGWENCSSGGDSHMLKITGHTAGTRPTPDLSDSKAEPQSHRAQVPPRLRGRSQVQLLSFWSMWDT